MNWRQKVNRRLVVVPTTESGPRTRIVYEDLGLAVEHRRMDDLGNAIIPAWLEERSLSTRSALSSGRRMPDFGRTVDQAQRPTVSSYRSTSDARRIGIIGIRTCAASEPPHKTARLSDCAGPSIRKLRQLFGRRTGLARHNAIPADQHPDHIQHRGRGIAPMPSRPLIDGTAPCHQPLTIRQRRSSPDRQATAPSAYPPKQEIGKQDQRCASPADDFDRQFRRRHAGQLRPSTCFTGTSSNVPGSNRRALTPIRSCGGSVRGTQCVRTPQWLATQAGEIGRVGIGSDVAIQLALDHHLIGRVIDALKAGLAAQAAIAVGNLVGLVRHGDADTAAMTRADQRAH